MKQTKKQRILYSTILHKIYTKHAVSRIDIAGETGITPATVSLITAELLQEGIIREAGEEIDSSDKVGRKKILLSIRPGFSHYVGAEISERFLSFVLADNTGCVTHKETYPFSEYSRMDSSSFLEHLNRFLSSIPQGEEQEIAAIGIAIPGHYSSASKSRILTNNPYWAGFDLEEIAAKVSAPVYYSNNVQCMAHAESLFYSSPENSGKNFMFFHIGRGIHCTHMYRNSLYSRHNMKIGEVGHLIVHPDGELCECGKRGCLQTYASETWLVNKARLLFQTTPHTCLHQLTNDSGAITLDTVITAFNLGDEAIVRLVSSAVRHIGLTISNLNMVIDSERVFVHGQLFTDPRVTAMLREELSVQPRLFMTAPTQELIIKPYSLFTGAIGASALCVLRHLLEME